MPSYEQNVQSAIRLLRSIPKDGPIELAYSGGKDSDVLLELAKMAGVEVVPIYRQTSIDPPGTTAHVKANGVEVRRPKETMLAMIERSGTPTMLRRWCCQRLKEYPIHARVIIGVRRSESKARAERYSEPEACRVYGKGVRVRQYYPLLWWSDEDVERFIAERGIKCHPLYYDENGRFRVERRLGCVGCPMSQRGAREGFKKMPKLLALWLRSLRRYRERHPDSEVAKLFRDEYDQMFCNLYCHSKKDFLDRINFPIYPVGCTDKAGWRERYFGIKAGDSPHFPDERFKFNTRLFLEDEFGINFEAFFTQNHIL